MELVLLSHIQPDLPKGVEAWLAGYWKVSWLISFKGSLVPCTFENLTKHLKGSFRCLNVCKHMTLKHMKTELDPYITQMFSKLMLLCL